ncbi:MAG: TRAP transporter substrate-binding protein [Phycisphaerae bacterium]|nr:TRAP transporter substrate-binding protein [Phycisphaerae bacterium]
MKQSTSMLFLGILIGILLVVFTLSGYIAGLNNSDDNSSGADSTGNKKIVLQLAHGLNEEHPVHKGMLHMAKRLDELSGGTLAIKISPSGQLGSEPKCVEDVQAGVLAMVKTSTDPLGSFIPVTSVFSYPYLFRDSEHQWKVLNGPIGKKILQEMRSKDLLGLCYYDAGARSFYTKDKYIKSPDDLKGLTIRVMNSQIATSMVVAMGATPKPVDFGELYGALQTGLVHGAENNPPSYFSNAHYEVCNYYSLDEHTMIPDVLLISPKVFDALTPQQQQWLQQAADESSIEQRKLWAKSIEDIFVELKEKGFDVYRPTAQEKDAFFQQVKPMYDQISNKEVADLIKQIREVK